MQVQILLVAASPKKPHKGAFAPTFDANKDGAPALNGTATTHGISADLWKAAEHAGTIFWIESGLPSQAAYILCRMHAGPTVSTLLHYEKLLLFQVVEQTDIVGSNEELRVVWIRFLGLEPVDNFTDDIHVEIPVNLIDGDRGP